MALAGETADMDGGGGRFVTRASSVSSGAFYRCVSSVAHDVVIRTSGGDDAVTVHSHRLMLSSLSPLLCSVLSDVDHHHYEQNICIILPDIAADTVRSLLIFIYSEGNLTTRSQTLLSDVMDLVQLLQFSHSDDIVIVNDQLLQRCTTTLGDSAELNEIGGGANIANVSADENTGDDAALLRGLKFSRLNSVGSKNKNFLPPSKQKDNRVGENQSDVTPFEQNSYPIKSELGDNGETGFEEWPFESNSSDGAVNVELKKLISALGDAATTLSTGCDEQEQKAVAMVKCSICKCMVSSSRLKAHMKIHKRKDRLKLNGRSTTKYYGRKMNTKAEDRLFKCTQCPYATDHKQKLRYHIAQRHSERPYKCEVCTFASADRWKLERHKRTKLCSELYYSNPDDNSENPYNCNACSYSTFDKWKMIRHRRTKRCSQRANADEAVDETEFDFTDPTLSAHDEKPVADLSRASVEKDAKTTRVKKAPVPPQMVKCDVCKCVVSRCRLKLHMSTHTGEKPNSSLNDDDTTNAVATDCCSDHAGFSSVCGDENGKPFQCSFCAFSTKHERNMAIHVRRHTTPKPRKAFTCEFCGHISKRKQALEYHLKTHTDARPYKCPQPQCDHASRDKYELKKHVQNMHTDEKRFQCDQCSYGCNRPDELRYHMDKHAGVLNFKCDVCPFATAGRKSLRSHMKTHTGENRLRPKTFLCSFCSFASATKAKLNSHMRRHTKEKPFKCDFEACTYITSWRESLAVHKKIHSGEKPYKCLLCSYSSIAKAKLRRHILTHSSEKPLKCSECSYVCADKYSLSTHMKRHAVTEMNSADQMLVNSGVHDMQSTFGRKPF